MPGSQSSILDHPERLKIDAMLLSRVPLRTIADAVTPKVSPMSLQRYKTIQMFPSVTPGAPNSISIEDLARNAGADTPRTISPSLPPATAAPTPLRQRVEKIYTRLEKALDTGEAVADGEDKVGGLRALAPLFRAATDNLRMQGELTGELNNAPQVNVNISIVTQAAPAAHRPYDMEIVPGDGDIGLDGAG